jgi:hypothetical protein
MTIERPMFPPRDSSRRGFLTMTAGGAVAAAIPTAVVAGIPTSVDPVFELIEIHRKAHIAHMAALQLQTRFERRYGIGGASWVSEKPCHDEDDAFTAFVAEPAATVQGLVRKAGLLRRAGRRV